MALDDTPNSRIINGVITVDYPVAKANDAVEPFDAVCCGGIDLC